MSKLKMCGGLLVTLVGVLILITTIMMYVESEETGFVIGGLIFGVPALLGGILGLASKVTAGGVLASIIAGLYIYAIIMTSLEIPVLGVLPLSFFLYQWDLYLVLEPFNIFVPLEALFIIFGGIFLLKSVNEQSRA